MADESDRAARRQARLQAERQRRRKARRKQRSSKRGLITGAAVVGVIALGGGAFAVLRDSGEGATGDDRPAISRAGSTVLEDAPAVDFGLVPAAARVTYRVETAGESITVLTDELSVRRPWEAALVTRDGPPPGGEEFSRRVGWFLRTALAQASGAPSIVEVAPALPPTDLRLERVLPLAVERNLVERREVREVAGRACQVYRSRTTLAAPIQPPAPGDHVDSCIDEQGLLLEEVVTVDGDVLTRRVATDVTLDPALVDDLFRVEGESLGAREGGGFVRKVKEGSTPPGEFLVLDAPPDGFSYRGRYSVVPAQPENFGDDPTRESFRRAGVVDAYESGTDILVIDQGGTLRGGEAFEATPGAPRIQVGPFGEGELLLSGAGVEVRVAREGGRYLRIYGTLPPDQLVAVASSLRAVEGGTLELEDL